MLTLPYKSLDQNTNLFQVGLGATSLVEIHRGELGFKDRVLLQLFFGALRVVFRYVAWAARTKIQDADTLTAKLEDIDILRLTAEEYKTLRLWRDGVAMHLAKVEAIEIDEKYMPKYMLTVMNQYRTAYARQISVLDAAFGSLDVQPKEVHGFTSQTETEIWNNRAKAYDYLV